MKKLISFGLVAAMLFSLASCGGTDSGITTPAVTTPAVTTPAVTTPAVTTPAVTTPAVTTPAVTTPVVTTPDVTTPPTGKDPEAEKEALRAELDAAWAARWDNVTDPNLRAALQDLYALYDAEKLVEFFASLWDKDAGGFFYADSARDYVGFEVDLESTYQILNIIRGMGMLEEAGDLSTLLGEEMTRKIVGYVQSAQDPDDGYFYNPQFDKNVGTVRKGRDLSQSLKILEWLGAEPLYPTALDRVSAASTEKQPSRYLSLSGATVHAVSDNLKDAASLEAYVRELIEGSTVESWSNTLSAQVSTVQAAGLLSTLLDVLDSYQDPASGMWVKQKNADGTYLSHGGAVETAYSVLTAAYKVAIIYNTGSVRQIKYADAFAASAIEAAQSEIVPATMPYLFNPWASLSYLRSNILRTGGSLASYNALIATEGVGMIDGLIAKLSLFRKADGSYSYYQKNAAAKMYGTVVCLGLDEGDVNATMLAIKSISDAVKNVFGAGSINIFNYRHADAFVALCESAEPIVKREVPNVIYDYEFSEGKSGESVSAQGVTASPGADTTFTYQENPSDSTDMVLNIGKSSTSNTGGGSITFRLMDGVLASGRTRITLDFDLYVPSGAGFTQSGNPNLWQIRINTGAGYFHMMTIRLPSTTGSEGFYLGDSKSTGGGYANNWSDQLFAFDTWHHLTVVYTIENADTVPSFGSAKLIMNDAVVAESLNFYANDYDKNAADAKEPTHGTFVFANAGSISILFAPQMRTNADLLIDGLTMSLENGDPDAEEPEETPAE